MQKNKIYVANWKMYWTTSQATLFAERYHDELAQLTSQATQTIVICPSFLAIAPTKKILNNTNIVIGAQDCAPSASGAFTGQVMAEDLKINGADYCIIGHSEKRLMCHESDSDVAEKIKHCLTFNIVPIVCVGETQEQYEAGKTFSVLAQQLTSITKHDYNTFQLSTFIIAYEPVWAIGTNLVASPEHITRCIDFIDKTIRQKSNLSSCSYLYGGSVNEKNIQALKTITSVNGFLIGGASLSFESIKKIVESKPNQSA